MTQDLPKPALPSIETSDEALRWIMKLHSGTATVADRRGFQAWRAQSETHEAAAKEAESLWAEAGDLHVDPETGVARPGRAGGGATRRNFIAGAAGFAVVGSGLWATGALRSWTADYRTGTAETRAVSLPDGSRVTLNARSAIGLRFSTAGRRVALLDGQAFFEVAPDSARPFEVESGGVVTTAVGTAFDVDRNLGDGGVVVSVTQHAVVVSASASGLSTERIRLLEDQSVEVDAGGHIGLVTSRAASVTAAWQTGMYIAEDRTLGSVVAALQSYHVGWLVIRGRDTAALRVNAVLNLRAPDQSLDVLANGLPIIVRRLSPYLVVISST